MKFIKEEKLAHSFKGKKTNDPFNDSSLGHQWASEDTKHSPSCRLNMEELNLMPWTAAPFHNATCKYVLGCCSVKEYDLVALKNTLECSDIFSSFVDEESSILHFNLMEFNFYNNLKKSCKKAEEDSEAIDSFVFNKGIFVCWGLMGEHGNTSASKSVIIQAHSPILEFLNRYADHVWPTPWRRLDVLPYYYLANLPSQFFQMSSRLKNDCFYLKTGCLDELVAASLAFGRSVRLHVYERAVDDAILKFNELPSQLAAHKFDKHFMYGSSQVRKIRQWVGEIYAITVVVNIAEDFLDIPEYFWHHDTYQSVWRRVHTYFELDNRLKILNLRLKCLKDVLKVIARRRVSAQNHYLSFCVIILLVLNLILMIVEEYIDCRKSFN